MRVGRYRIIGRAIADAFAARRTLEAVLASEPDLPDTVAGLETDGKRHVPRAGASESG